ncbi:MAG TPA: DarT ssDNA thymidine ADP-ribosyltransferase family protein, partial [Ignavibacteria bacterium]|nr:DarT ssDNA thymidine ADP-ribosyltransferase family protein [Ignavibacteria bacterium]
SFFDVSNMDVQNKRHFKKIIIKDNDHGYLHNYVPLYFIPHTHTFYNFIDQQEKFFFIELDLKKLLSNKKCLFTNGNAASNETQFFEDFSEANDQIPWEVIVARYWNNFPDGKRKKNSEVLVLNHIETIYFKRIAVINDLYYDKLLKILDDRKWKGFNENFKIEVEPSFFFR